MAPNINNPGGVKNDPDEIRDGVVSDSTRFPGGFIDQQVTEAGAPVQVVGQFDLSNASFAQAFDVSSQDTSPTGLAFKPDGSRLYVAGDSSETINQYSLSTAFDVTTASFTQAFDVRSQDNELTGISFRPDGSQMHITGQLNSNVYQYNLSTAFDVSTASFDLSLNVKPQDQDPSGLAFEPDGSQLYVTGRENSNVYQYSLSTAFDISTASFVLSFGVAAQDTRPTEPAFKPDGTQLYVAGTSSDNVYQYSLSTAFDVSTASFTQAFDVSSQSSNPAGLAFNPDGTYLYVVGIGDDKVNQYAVGFVGDELG